MIREWISRRLIAFLTKRVESSFASTSDLASLEAALRPGDVLLVDGDTRIAVVIKYITQSTWSHAALYLGPDAGLPVDESGEPHVLIEADVETGIRTLPLSFYEHEHTRICHPIGLNRGDIDRIADYAKARIGNTYDLKNVFDLARYLLPVPPMPRKYHRRMLAFGSGDPTRAICSSLIAQSFQHIRYPILPIIKTLPSDDPRCIRCEKELFNIRHHTLFTPRDFDASPYFQVVKPSLSEDFDFRAINWEEHEKANR